MALFKDEQIEDIVQKVMARLNNKDTVPKVKQHTPGESNNPDDNKTIEFTDITE